ncbi:MAG: amidohydrolase [Bacteroidota bacterium]
MQDLNVTIIQSKTHWESVAANLAMFEEKIWEIEGQSDIIVLPEMFSTGFSMSSRQLAEPMNFTAFKWMKQMASQTGSALTGSIIIKENDAYYNRLIWMEPTGKFEYYDKRHLFRMADEHLHYSEGQRKLVINYKGWNICPLICYDLRFPVWSRNTKNKESNMLEYDLLLYVANWPAARVSAWDTLLRARAIENLCYTIGVNRIGNDGLEVAYNGHSAVIDPKGNALFEAGEDEVIQTSTLTADDLISYRKKFPAHLDGDSFKINL